MQRRLFSHRKVAHLLINFSTSAGPSETRHLKFLGCFIVGDVSQKLKAFNPILAIHEAYPTGACFMCRKMSSARKIKSRSHLKVQPSKDMASGRQAFW